MAKSDNGDVNNRLSPSSNNDPNNSFMKKVTSRVSGLLPTSLSKWFGESGRSKQVIRRRDDQNSADEDEDDTTTIQPPKKRARNAPILSDTTFTALSPSGFKFTSTPTINHNEHLMRLQPGPSGYTRQTNRETFDTLNTDTAIHLNGDDRSDSGESTSGYSSVPLPNAQKDSSSDKETKVEVNSSKILDKSPVTPVRSLFSEQSLTQNKSCLSSRRPSFNASTFGSPSFIDRTLTTKQIMNSPFYSGKTIFGGAAAYQRNRKIFPRDDAHRLAVKNSVQIKPINETEKTESNHLSKTAKRILDCLEHFNSPVADAKKIPPVIRQNIQSKKMKPSNKELLIPTVPELLKMKLKSRLQDSTVAVRNVATTSKSILNTEYSLRTADNSEKQKQSNKMKSKITSVREKRSELHEAPEQVILPEVTLPITNLPKFDFTLPAPTPTVMSKPSATITSSQTFTLPQTISEKKKESISKEYKFATPISINDVPKSIMSVNNFKFSQPLDVKKSNQETTVSTTPAIGFQYTPPTNIVPKRKEISKNNGQNKDLYIAPAAQLVTGSVMDILGKKDDKKEDLLAKFKPASGTWECTVCMVRNIETANKCIACETLRETKTKTVEQPKPTLGQFSSQFKMPTDKWECGVCLVRNNNSDSKCVACTSPKPGQTQSAAPTNNISSGGFGDKFKPSSDTWECGVCMIRNKSNAEKCVACESPKPGAKADKPSLIMPTSNKSGGFDNIVKKQQERWECSTCLVRNPTDAKQCTSCGTYRPGVPQFNFGTNPSAPKFKFGIDNTDAKATTTEVPTLSTSSSNTSSSFKFGVSPGANTEKGSTGFQFAAASSQPISFGIKPAESKNTPQFSFGVKEKKPAPDIVVIDDDDDDVPVKKSKPETPKQREPSPKKDSAPSSNAFLFGASTDKKDEHIFSPPKAVETPKPMFSFGQPASTSNKVEEKKISFGIPEKKSEPTEKAPLFNFSAPQTATTNTSTETVTPPVFAFGAPASTTNVASTETKSFSNSFQVPKFNFGSNALPFSTKPLENTSTVTTTTQSSLFTFGSAPTNATPKPSFELPKQAEVKPFSFGAPAQPKSAESFAFKSNDAPPSFTFGSVGNSSAPGNNMFSFESAAKPSETSSTFGSSSEIKPSLFGSPSTATTQAQPLNGGFNFTPSATPSTFKFGAPAPATTQAPAAFSFGQAGSGSAAPVFSFGSSVPTPAFNPDAKPSFNFTSGATPSFSAQAPASSSSTAPPGRKIRKAVRRVTQPR